MGYELVNRFLVTITYVGIPQTFPVAEDISHLLRCQRIVASHQFLQAFVTVYRRAPVFLFQVQFLLFECLTLVMVGTLDIVLRGGRRCPTL